MKIWDIAVNNRVAVYFLVAIIVIVGWTTYFSLPRESAPDITFPLIIVSTPYIGVSPTDIEGLVTQPLERNLKSLKDINKITSASKEGLSTIQVEFTTDVDVEEALRRVRDKVNSTIPELPSDILDPVVNEINFSEFPILYVNVGGNFGIARLREVAKELRDEIETVPGVLRADMNGAIEPEVQIDCDVTLMNGYEVSFNDVVEAVQNENISTPGGLIDDGRQSLSVRVPGEFKEVQPLEQIVVKLQNGKPIHLSDVATVRFAFEDRKTYARLNDKEVVSLAVRKRAGENLINIAEEVKAIVKQAHGRIPPGMSLTISNDQSVDIARSVRELENSIFTGMFLVIVVLFMFFGFKNSLLISTAIPLSMLIGFMVLGMGGITLNFVVLFALVLVLGILVDDAVVVIENIYRHQQDLHEDPETAAKAGTSEVAVPVVTSTLTTLAAFLPMLFWPGIVGDFMWYLPSTLIFTLGASLFVAFVVSPVQGAQWIDYKKQIRKAKEDELHPHWYKKYNPITILYRKVDEKFFPWAQEKYATSLRYALTHRWKTVGGVALLFVVVLALLVVFYPGDEFFPTVEPNLVNITIETPPGTALEVTNGIALDIEKRLKKVEGAEDIEFVVASIGTSDNPFDFGGQGTPNKGSIAVNFYERKLRNHNTFETLEAIRDAISDVQGGVIKVSKQEHGPPVGSAVSIEISGDDYDVLTRLSARLQDEVRSVPNLVDLKDNYNAGKPEIEVNVDRERAALFHMSTAQVARTVRAAINGIEASKYRQGEDEYKIRVRLKEQQRSSVRDLENLNVTFRNKQGKLLSIPVVSVADIQYTTGIADIQRKDQKRVITVTAGAQGRSGPEVLRDVKARLEEFSLPNGVQLKYSGEDEEQAKAMAFLSKAFLITILLVLFVLVAEFGSIKVPIVIMVSIIFSFIGVFVGHIVTQIPISTIMTGIGIIALVGIVVKNAIVLLDFIKNLRGEGLTLEEALVQAGRTRLRPVVLTAVTTILGILPLATGFDFDWRALHFVIGAESADFWRPLGVAIIFGLAVSTFLTLVVVPTIYSLLEHVMARARSSISKMWMSSVGKRVEGTQKM